MKEISMDARFIEAVESGRKTRTARLESKANVGEIVGIYNRPYVIVEKKILPFPRLVEETWEEEGFFSKEEFATVFYRLYGTEVYSSHLYSHKFKPYMGEISDQIECNGKVKTCFGCPLEHLYTVPTSWGGEFFCRRDHGLKGGWNTAQKSIKLPERCGLYEGGCDGKDTL